MGDLIQLAQRRRASTGERSRRRGPAALGRPASLHRERPTLRPLGLERRALRHPTHAGAFYFDLTCPFSYMAAERVERVMGDVDWVPVPAAALRGQAASAVAGVRAHAETCAVALRIPLVWPERPLVGTSALRIATYARDAGRTSRFALAASRLAFCGGFDLEDPEILVEAAAAAGLPLDGCLAAARDATRDQQLEAAGRRLLSAGIDCLPAVRLGHRWLAGEEAVAQAAAFTAGGASRAAGAGSAAPRLVVV